MRILYIYPHPDDESFGPATVMSQQRRQGHEVFLLTLTRGGATRQRHKYGYSVEEMGEVRFKEMQQVAEVLDLSELRVLDLPDGGLKEMDPYPLYQMTYRGGYRILPSSLNSTEIIYGLIMGVPEKRGARVRHASYTGPSGHRG